LLKSKNSSVALFGGSFDPPHIGHQAIVLEALRILDIDELIVVPAYLNPFKVQTFATAQKRLMWCKSIFESIPKATVSDFELLQKRPVFTFETVKHFQLFYHVKYLIVGADNLPTLNKWHSFEWLNSQITWIIVTRQTENINTDFLNKSKILSVNVPISSTQIREGDMENAIDIRILSSVKNVIIASSRNKNLEGK